TASATTGATTGSAADVAPSDPAATTPLATGAVQTGTLPTTPSTSPIPSSTTPAATTPAGGIADPPAVRGAATPVSQIKGWIPNDHIGAVPWTALQWNFVAKYGVNASEAWETLRKRGAKYEGGKGVRVAVVDSGVAYRNQGVYRASPDLPASRILAGYDFVDDDRFPDDQSGHGTHVASTIAGADDNDAGLTGLAYNAEILPVRVLDDKDQGDVVAIARGIRYAARHPAQILNISIDFPVGITETDIPEVMSAIAYARHKGVLMIASSGNNGGNRIALPARSSSVLAVGATTVRGCRSVYSNAGPELDIAAPGGGQDHAGERGCHPNRTGPPIAQVTILDPADPKDSPDPSQLGVPLDYVGTSMAAGHVTGVAALVAASGILGTRPSANLLAAYLVRSTRDLGPRGRDNRYGAGLIDAEAAVSRSARTTTALRGARRAANAATAHRQTALPVL
ncbi:MAG: S8 family serine peptidase, partial [Solirubrobacteraceae bacterium]